MDSHALDVPEELKDSAVSLVDYERTLFMNILTDDYLVVFAQGIGCENILRSFVYVYANSQFLVLIINMSESNTNSLLKFMEKKHPNALITHITGNVITNKREKIYKSGGVVISSSRILVNDILCGRLPLGLVTGLIVCRAHKVAQFSPDSYVVKAYKEANHSGFIKAFSDCAHGFTQTSQNVEQIMKRIRLKKLMLYPRFHLSVSSCFEKSPVDVVELGIELSADSLVVHFAILDLLKKCLYDLGSCTSALLHKDDLTLERALHENYDKFLKNKLNPSWNLLNRRTTELISSVKILTNLLSRLHQRDVVHLFNYFKFLRKAKDHENKQLVSSHQFSWLMMKESETIYLQLLHINTKLDSMFGSLEIDRSHQNLSKILSVLSPKYGIFLQILEEIEKQKMNRKKTEKKVFVITPNQILSQVIRRLITNPYDFLKNTLMEISSLRETEITEEIPIEDSENTATVKRKACEDSTESDVLESINSSNLNILILSSEEISLCTRTHRDILDEFQPDFVIMYSPQLDFIRQIEHYQASYSGKFLRVYFLMYKNSAEEQMYLNSLKQEKDAFEKLISKKASFVPEYLDYGSGLVMKEKFELTNTENVGKIIVVDSRELKSSLPFTLLEYGFDIKPVVLDIGDYVLTPSICVERKSIPDLIGSLNSGRLYNQMTSMTKNYKNPLLLLEFDNLRSCSVSNMLDLASSKFGKVYGLSNSYQHLSATAAQTSTFFVQSKLILLIMHFPTLRIIWSSSPKQTAQIFDTLKFKRPDPSPGHFVSTSTRDQGHSSSRALELDSAIEEVLIRMPGMSTKSINTLQSCPQMTLKDFVNSSKIEMSRLFNADSSVCEKLYDFIHRSLSA